MTSVLAAGSSGFEAPTVDDFFPPAFLFAGTPFAVNRIMAIRIIVVALIALWLWLATRHMRVVPGRGQVINEWVIGFVRNGIIVETLGEKDAKRFMVPLMTMFFVILGMNLTEVIPPFLIPASSVIGLPLVFAVIAYVMFLWAGIKQHGAKYFMNILFPPGVPWPLYILLTPVEAFSTFILRPVTLILRLLMNMVAGHLLLALCFAATQFFLFEMLTSGQLLGLLGVGTAVFGIVFTAFEIFVGALQAYVFTFLAAIYIQMDMAEEH